MSFLHDIIKVEAHNCGMKQVPTYYSFCMIFSSGSLPSASLREQEGQREAEAPIGPTCRGIGIVAVAELHAKRLAADLEYLGHLEDDGNGPLAVLPVVGGLGDELPATKL